MWRRNALPFWILDRCLSLLLSPSRSSTGVNTFQKESQRRAKNEKGSGGVDRHEARGGRGGRQGVDGGRKRRKTERMAESRVYRGGEREESAVRVLSKTVGQTQRKLVLNSTNTLHSTESPHCVKTQTKAFKGKRGLTGSLGLCLFQQTKNNRTTPTHWRLIEASWLLPLDVLLLNSYILWRPLSFTVMIQMELLSNLTVCQHFPWEIRWIEHNANEGIKNPAFCNHTSTQVKWVSRRLWR